jgi:hypothetical protein
MDIDPSARMVPESAKMSAPLSGSPISPSYCRKCLDSRRLFIVGLKERF